MMQPVERAKDSPIKKFRLPRKKIKRRDMVLRSVFELQRKFFD